MVDDIYVRDHTTAVTTQVAKKDDSGFGGFEQETKSYFHFLVIS